MRKIVSTDNLKAQHGNKGFTLVEVIIAVVIMAIAAIPILHAFSTTANTSSKALIKMRATNAAENIMEDIKGLSLEEVIDKYGDPSVTYPNEPGKNPDDPSDPTKHGYVPQKGSSNTMYQFELTSGDHTKFNDDINKVLDNGYTATIEVDPTFYPNINSINLSDFDEVNRAHSAIFAVSSSIDEEALEKFSDLSGSLAEDNPYARMTVDERKKEFKPVLKREIRIDVTKKGTGKDEDDNEMDYVEVKGSVNYLLPDNETKSYVPIGTATQRIYNRKLFVNTSTTNRLNSVFIFYNPLYDSAKDIGDIIIVHNKDSVKFNLYIVAQNTLKSEEDKDNWDSYRKKEDKGGLVLEIYENEVDGKQPVTLYTNLHDDVEYSRKLDSELIPVQCYINLGTPSQDPEGTKDTFTDSIYNKLKNKKGSWENKEAAEKLDARDIDGKNLDASKVKDKIYDVRVTVKKDTVEANGEWPIEVTLTGTLVDE